MLPPIAKLLIILGVGLPGFTLSVSAQSSGSSSTSKVELEARIDLLREEWHHDPANLRMAIVLAGNLRINGQAEEGHSVVSNAIKAVEKRIETEGDSAELYYLLGTGALFLNKNDVALDRFQIALALAPEREEVHLGLIRTLIILNRDQEARDALDLAIALFPESEAVKRQLALAHVTAKRFDEAVPILEELLVLNPEDQDVFNQLLEIYVETGNAEKASPLFDRLAESGSITPIESAIHVFRIFLANGDLRSARIELQRASQVDESHPLVKDSFREYYSIQAKQAESEDNNRRALLFWERALENSPDDWQAKYHLAQTHAALKNYQEALDLYLPLLEKKPADPVFYGDLSLTLIALERFDAAVKVLQLGLKIASQSGNNAALAQLETIRERLTYPNPGK